MGAETFISDLRESLAALTQADPYFSDIPVITEEVADLESRIEKLIARTTGICLVMTTPQVRGALANVGGANFTGIVLAASVLENPTLNKTGKKSLDVAVYLCNLWQQIKPDVACSALKPQENPIERNTDLPSAKYRGHNVFFETEGGMKIDIPRLAAPTANNTNLAAVTLSTATPGAATFYTLDNSVPTPRNPAATLFQSSFSALSGQTIRARSWLAGYLPSPETKLTLNS